MFEVFNFKKSLFAIEKVSNIVVCFNVIYLNCIFSLMWFHLQNYNQTEYLMIKPMDVPTKYLDISIMVFVHLTEHR